MPDPKKQSFIFADDDGQEYEFVAADVPTALRAAREYAASKSTPDRKLNLTSTFDLPEEFVKQQEATAKWWADKQRERETIEKGGGGFVQGLAPLVLAGALGTSAARTGAHMGADLLDNLSGGRQKAETGGNRFLRDLARFAPAAGMAGPAAGATSFGIGRLIDRLAGETNATPPGRGEIASEVIGNTIPGLRTLQKAGPGGAGGRAVDAGVSWMTKHPLLAQLGVGGATGAAATVDRNTDAATGAGLGMGTAAAGYAGGKAMQRFLNSLPSLENPKVLTAVKDLGYDPTAASADDQLLQATGAKLKKPAAAIAELEKAEVNIPEQIAAETEKVKNARTLPSAQAANKSGAAFKVLSAAQEEDSLNKLRAARALQEQSKVVKTLETQVKNTTAVGGAKAAQEAKLAREQMKLWTLKEGITRMNATKSPGVMKARREFIDADTYERRLKEQRTANQFSIADREARLLGATAVYDRISETGFDPRTLGPNEKAAVKLLATEAPGEIIQKMKANPAEAEVAVKGLTELFGPKSAEVAAVRNRFAHEMMEGAALGDEGKFSGHALSGKKLRNFLSQFDSKTINTLFGTEDAANRLADLSNVMSRSESLRHPGESFRIFLTPMSLGGLTGLAMGGGENSLPYSGVGLAIGATIVGAWKTVPAMLDDIIRKGSKTGKLLERLAKSPNPGESSARVTSKVVSQLGSSTVPKEEETPAAPQ